MADKKKKIVKRVAGVFSDAGKAAKKRAEKRRLAVKRKAIEKNVAAKKEKDAAGMRKAKSLSAEGMAAAAKKKDKKAKMNKAIEAEMKAIMKAGQRQYDPKTGLVMNKGGLAKKSKRIK